MTNKLAVVTGGASGIGKEITLFLARNGWDVAFTWFGSEQQQAQLVAELELAASVCSSVGTVFSQRCDVGNKDAVERFYQNLETHFDRVPNLLVNNAGVQVWAPLLELEESDWDRVIQTNLKGCFLNIQAFANRLVAAGQSGSVVNIGSGCNKNPFPKLVSYTASKGGVELLTRSAAIELGQYQIRVNCVAPGAIEVERTLLEDPGYREVWSAFTPLGRPGVPADISSAVRFLSSDESAYITGQTLYVDGGAFAQSPWPSAYK